MTDLRRSSQWLRTALLATLLSGVFLGSACICFAAEADASEGQKDHANKTQRPVIAVVPVQNGELTPLIALLEDRLSRSDRCVLVDREHIDKVVKEQELGVLSAAASVSERIALSRLLGADLLVLLSKHATPQPHCEIVVSETSRGLRLQVSKLPISGEAEKDAQAIQREIENALKKQARPFTSICAVPPFVCRDVSDRHEHLQGTYARMLETMLLQIPGIVVAELVEARAIAAETSLTGGNVERSLPLYLVGEYRYDTGNPRMPPYVKITAYRGERTVGSREAKGLSPETAPPFLRKSVVELVGAALHEKFPETNRKAERDSLSRRAQLHFSMGNYEEAAQLAEASLLLDLRQPKIHHLAMNAYGGAYGGCWWETEDVRERLRCCERALVHLEHFLRQTDFQEVKIDEPVYGTVLPDDYVSTGADDDTKEAVYAHRRRRRDMYIRVIKAKHDAGTLNDVLLRMIHNRILHGPNHYGETLRENLARRLEVVPMLLGANVKYPQRYIPDLVKSTDATKMTEEFSQFLDAFGRHDHPVVNSVVASERELISRLNAPRDRRRPNLRKQESPSRDDLSEAILHPEVEFVPIVLERTDGKALSRPFHLCGLMRCGERVDLVWGRSRHNKGYLREVFLMEKKGQLRPIFQQADKQPFFGQAVFDGTYAWLPIGGPAWLPISGPQGTVLVINPTTGSVVRFTVGDGLPLPLLASPAAASLGEGRLCLSASSGRGAFIAVLELSKSGDKRARIIHEATKKLLPGISPSVQYRDPQLAYAGRFMISKATDKENSWIVVLARSMPGFGGRSPSLLIDPNAGKVEVIDATVGSQVYYEGNVAFHENAAYWGTREGLRCLRIDSRDSKVLRELPTADGLRPYARGAVMLYDGRLHFVGREWWVADDLKAPFRKLSGRVPGTKTWFYKLFVSSHYGLVFRTREAALESYQVIFHDVAGRESE